MSAIAIITARGGSKRIPKKNIKEFCGKPIIAYSIEAAFASKIFTEVMVSTDDPEIAYIAIQYGAKVPFLRSNETSDDFSTTRDVLDEVIATYKTKLKRRFFLGSDSHELPRCPRPDVWKSATTVVNAATPCCLAQRVCR